MEPLPFQEGAIQRHSVLLKNRETSAEASVAGFGKTFVAAFTSRELGYPMVVLCPKVVVPHWEAAAKAVGAPIRCISNYEQHKLGHTGMGIWRRKPSRVKNRAGEAVGTKGGVWEWTFPVPTMLVFDEGHTLKSETSQTAKLGIAAKRQGIPSLVMSATLAQDPLDLFTVGYMLGLHNGESRQFMAWASMYGVRPDGFGFAFDPKFDPLALDRLHHAIFPLHGHRKTYAEIPGFPDATTDVREVEADPHALQQLEKLWGEIREIEVLKEEAQTAVVERLRARQIAELEKVPGIIDYAKDLINSGLSVPIFVNFHQTIDALHQAFPDWKIIDGRHSSNTYRAAAIADFQADRSRGLIIQSKAGGVGISLHDLNGKHARHSLISPPDSARDLIQDLGRNRRVGQKTPAFRTIITLADSIERKVRANVMKKADQIETINDGDLDPLK